VDSIADAYWIAQFISITRAIAGRQNRDLFPLNID
jgi:hypothetical protein